MVEVMLDSKAQELFKRFVNEDAFEDGVELRLSIPCNVCVSVQTPYQLAKVLEALDERELWRYTDDTFEGAVLYVGSGDEQIGIEDVYDVYEVED